MSHKLLYRTACFIFGFGIGVIYFASPSSNHQSVHADTIEQLPESVQTSVSNSLTESPAQIDSLEQEAAELAALEAQLEQQLSGNESAIPSMEGQGVSERVVGPVVQVTAENNDSSRQVQAQADVPVAKSQVTSELEEYTSEAPTPAALTNTTPESIVRAMPKQNAHIRAQMRAPGGRAPARVMRKVIVFENDGATAEEKILEIDVQNGIPGSEFVPIEFDKDEQYSKLMPTSVPRKSTVRKSSPTVSQAPIVSVADRSKPTGSRIARQVTDLKQQNIDLREQVLSLRVMMEAMQDEPISAATQQNSIAGPSASIDSPQVLSVTKQNSRFWAPDELTNPHQSQAQVVPSSATVQPKGSFESQPGDPALVRYDRTPLRTGPGTNYSRVAVLREGTVLTVDYHRNGWFRVYTQDGVRAWIAQDAIRWF